MAAHREEEALGGLLAADQEQLPSGRAGCRWKSGLGLVAVFGLVAVKSWMVGRQLRTPTSNFDFEAKVADPAEVVSDTSPPSLGRRKKVADEVAADCINCAGRKGGYTVKPGVRFVSYFPVPPIPEVFDPDRTTYYEYFNIFWSSKLSPPGGHDNQFVPQLYLGAVDDTGGDSNNDWKSRGGVLKTWHMNAFYYFSTCKYGWHTCTSATMESKAASGPLVPVYPGETIWTSFTLSDDWVWTMSMGVYGFGTERQSDLTVARPFMGILGGAWWEPRYSKVTVAGCMENYNQRAGSLFEWWARFEIYATEPEDFTNWEIMERATQCPWAPSQLSIESRVDADKKTHRVWWYIK